MQANAQVLQQGFVTRDGARLRLGNHAYLGQFAPSFAQIAGAANPQHGLQIAQTTGAFFQVGLKVVVRVHEASVAPLLFILLGEVESAMIKVSCQRGDHFLKQLGCADN